MVEEALESSPQHVLCLLDPWQESLSGKGDRSHSEGAPEAGESLGVCAAHLRWRDEFRGGDVFRGDAHLQGGDRWSSSHVPCDRQQQGQQCLCLEEPLGLSTLNFSFLWMGVTVSEVMWRFRVSLPLKDYPRLIGS